MEKRRPTQAHAEHTQKLLTGRNLRLGPNPGAMKQ